MSGFTKIAVGEARRLASAALKRVYEHREEKKQERIARIQANREWWRKYLPWLKPLTLEQAQQAYEVEKQNHWLMGSECWGQEQKSQQVLVLCKHSGDGYVYLMPELLNAIERD